MGYWIESHQQLARHPKTIRLARMLKINIPQVIGHLHLLWWWTLDYSPTGELSAFTSCELAGAAEWTGDADFWLSAMIECRWIDNEPLRVHDWYDFAGKLIEQREKAAERKRRSRGRHAEVTRTSRATEPNRTKPNQTKPTKTETCNDSLSLCQDSSAKSSVRAESIRFFGFIGLKKIFEKCGWKTPNDLEKAVNTARKKSGKLLSVERFMQCLIDKEKLKNPAGATIYAFKNGWNPTDKAIRRLRDLIDPPEPRNASPQTAPDPEYLQACSVFKSDRAFWENQGVYSAKELLAYPDFQKALAEKGKEKK